MKIVLSDRVIEALEDVTPAVRKAFHKQLGFLEHNLHHPSLRAKKYDESLDLWQARVTKGWRFFFTIEDDTYIIVRIVPHPK